MTHGSTINRPTIAIVGAGFAGLGMAISLKRAGLTDFTVFERGDDVGGCWRMNTYPGAACDVPSHLYSFSFAPNPRWSRRFAPQPEILDYLQHCAREYDLHPHIRLGTAVESAVYDDAENTWAVTLADGTVSIFDLVVFACGQLSRPATPHVPGIEQFEGTVFHSAQWDHDYPLAGKRVAVVGTGASAIQFVPKIADEVSSLHLFQRSAPYVIPKADYPYSQRVRRVFAALPAVQRLSRWLTYATLEPRVIAFNRYPGLMKLFAWRYRRLVAKSIPDPRLREALKPDYPIGCKRILISNDYLASLAGPHVDVVTEPIAEVGPSSITVADGTSVEVDAIIFGTGFHATDFLRGISVTGRDDTDLHTVWADGAYAHLGLTVNGFPNMFLLYGPNTNLGHTSIILMLEAQMRYIIEATRLLRVRRGSAIEVRTDAESMSNDAVQAALSETVWNQGCNSWYKTASGKNTNNWPASTAKYIRMTRSVDEDDYTWGRSSA